MEFKESDWKVFRRLHSVALERYCRRVLEEVRVAAGLQKSTTTIVIESCTG